MKKFKTMAAVAAVSAGLGLSQLAVAEAGRFYLGTALGQADYDVNLRRELDDGSLTSASTDTKDISVKLFGGYWLSDFIAVELGYLDLGEISLKGESDGSSTFYFQGPVRASIEVDGFVFGLAGRAPINEVIDITGKIGVMRWEADFSGRDSGGSFGDNEKGTDIYFGVGAAARIFPNMAVHLGFERFDVDDIDVDVISLGATFNF